MINYIAITFAMVVITLTKSGGRYLIVICSVLHSAPHIVCIIILCVNVWRHDSNVPLWLPTTMKDVTKYLHSEFSLFQPFTNRLRFLSKETTRDPNTNCPSEPPSLYRFVVSTRWTKLNSNSTVRSATLTYHCLTRFCFSGKQEIVMTMNKYKSFHPHNCSARHHNGPLCGSILVSNLWHLLLQYATQGKYLSFPYIPLQPSS